MLISEFARSAGLPVDTVRFYIRRGLLKPAAGGKGGANPYQVFTEEDLDRAKAIRMGQSLGFSLKEISALNDEFEAGAFTLERSAALMRYQLGRLEQKEAQLSEMIAYTRAKIAWLDAGGVGAEPRFRDYEACMDKRVTEAA